MVRGMTAYAAAGLLAMGMLQQAPEVNGHAYLMSPVSRNFYYTPVFQEDDFSEVEYCPHCMQSRGPEATQARGISKTPSEILREYGNGEWPHLVAYERGELAPNGNYLEPDSIAVRHGICGDPEQNSEEVSNTYGQANTHYPILGTYTEGAVIEMKVVMSVYHWGHLEFFICSSEDQADGPDGIINQGCFNTYPLTRASDDGSASPLDPVHPGRYYVDPPCREFETDQTKPDGAEPGPVITARYQLPEGLTCERCIVQMVYYTAHKCRHPGYVEFDPPSFPSECAPNKEDWFDLGPEICGENGLYPEEFWNCADIAITSDGSAPKPSPTPASPAGETEPISAPTSPEPQPQPVYEEPEPAPAPEPQPVYEEPEPAPTPESPPTPDAECSDPVSYYEECSDSTCCIPGYECMEMSDSYSECRPVDGGCSGDWKQCGGQSWTGTTCCWPGALCLEEDEWFSQCVPQPDAAFPRPSREDPGQPEPNGQCADAVAAPYDECVSNDCCRIGYACENMDGSYSECRPINGECSSDWEQCGGPDWSGPSCCWPGAICVNKTEYYDQCVPVEHL